MRTKRIIFLSIMDFTDNGIQVVRKTPEFFASQGWGVDYVVTRNESKSGSYYYQDEINPDGVNVHRTQMPVIKVFDRIKNKLFTTIYSKIRGYGSIIKLALIANKLIKKHDYDVIYGGGPHGILASKIVRLINFNRDFFVVSRFYGVWDLYSDMIVKKNFFRLILNFDIALSMFLKADRVIITNDGTQGDKALAAIRKSSIKNLRFYVNGVDRHNMSHTPIEKSLIDGFDYKYLSICVTRLVSIKRVDLSVKVIAEVVNNLKLADFGLVIVGDGVERQNLENLANSLGIREHILFLGSVDNNLVKSCLSKADLFLSTYDVSNVGNPLLEAIRMNKVIFTRNNGDTSFWIDHYVNGFIYDDKDIVEDMARDIVKLLDDNKLKEKIIRNIKLTEEKLLHTWTERLSLEFSDIDMFLSKERSK